MSCPCKIFLKDLINLCRDLYLDMHEQQWEKLQIFSKQCLCGNPKMINTYGVRPTPCLHQLCIWLLEKQNIFKQYRIEVSTLLLNCISNIYLDQPCVFNCRYVGYFVSRKCFDFKCNTIRVLAGLDGRCDHMKMLVNLNLISRLANHSKQLKDGITNNFCHIRDSLRCSWFSNDVALLKLTKYVFSFFNHHKCHARIFLATLAFRAIRYKMTKQEKKAKEYIHCLRMYFAVTQDLLLTLNEMRSMLYACLIVIGKLHLFESHYEEFVKLMPECPARMEPRNLTHLARYKIRQHMKIHNLPLPATVEKLDLPQLLKRFVLGDVIEVSQQGRNASPEQIITRKKLTGLVFKNRKH